MTQYDQIKVSNNEFRVSLQKYVGYFIKWNSKIVELWRWLLWTLLGILSLILLEMCLTDTLRLWRKHLENYSIIWKVDKGESKASLKSLISQDSYLQIYKYNMDKIRI